MDELEPIAGEIARSNGFNPLLIPAIVQALIAIFKASENCPNATGWQRMRQLANQSRGQFRMARAIRRRLNAKGFDEETQQMLTEKQFVAALAARSDRTEVEALDRMQMACRGVE